MADHRNGGAGRSASKRTAHTAGEASEREPKVNAAEPNATASGVPTRRKRQYLIGIRPIPGFASPSADSIYQSLDQMEDVEVLRRLRRKGFQGLGSIPLPGDLDIIVVRMEDQRAEALRRSAPPHVLVEHDARLRTGQGAFIAMPYTALQTGALVRTTQRHQEIRFQILGEGEKPVAGAGVTLFSRGPAAYAITDSTGTASVALFDAEADLEDIRAVHVQPAADHWSCFIQSPVLQPSGANVIKLNPLPPAAKSGTDRSVSWGQKAMNLDRAAGLSGAEVKVALIDSGCDNSHPLLRHITRGVDLTRHDSGKDWTQDEIGQGTHCAGIIAGSAGIAPSAEIHVFKMSPGGCFSDLIEALDQCIERQIDIVHLGVGCDQVSELVAQKLVEARMRGVACVTAAGDVTGSVQFPGMVPGVLCVSAVGRLGEYPQDTPHALTAIPELIGPSGIFATNFSGSGPSVGVCAPGVAVISSVPGGGFAARDGTAIAAAHVAGLAALILADHPLLRRAHANRGEQRVNALFELMRNSAVAPVFDPARVGAGLPDFQRVPGLRQESDLEMWNQAARNFATLAPRERFGERAPTGFAQPDLGTMALMQLRASGLI